MKWFNPIYSWSAVLSWRSLWLADCFSLLFTTWYRDSPSNTSLKHLGLDWREDGQRGHLVICAWREENDAPCFVQVEQKPRVCLGFLHIFSCEKHIVKVSLANSNASDVKSMLQRTSQERPSLIGQTSLALEIYLVYNLWPGTLHQSWHDLQCKFRGRGSCTTNLWVMIP